jgi:putative transposase
MKKRAEKGGGKQEGRGPTSSLSQLLAPLIEGMVGTRQRLLGWVHATGMMALDALFRDEAQAMAGVKGKHASGRTHHHWGTTSRELTFGGRRVSVPCPRVRSREGREATLPSVAVFRDRDPLTTRVIEQVLVGVSTRGCYDRSLEAVPGGLRSRGSSKSAVSRAFIARTRGQLQQGLNRRLEELPPVALLIDGVQVGHETVIVAMGVTREGKKEPLGLGLGSTENAVVCTKLVQDLLERGLKVDGRVLCVIDGGKGIRKALGAVLGEAAVIQRCQVHQLRNLEGLVPKARQVYVRSVMRRAYRAQSAESARRQLRALAGWLEQNGHVDAAGSLREGLDETITVLKLGLTPTLRRFFATTNCIENLISTVRRVARNVKRWRGGQMIHRWFGLGLRQAAQGFRRIKGHGELDKLAAALRGNDPTERVA